MIRECTTGPEGCLVRDAQSVRGKGGHGPEGPWRVHRLDQSVLSRNAVSWDFDRAPTLVASTSPFLNTVSVGMPRTPYFLGVSGFSSMFSLAMVS